MDAYDNHEEAMLARDRMVFDTAIRTYGKNAQINVAIEECAELIVALQHHARNKCAAKDVVSEIADVEIMITQLKMIFGDNDVENEKKIKIQRLADNLLKETMDAI